MHLTLLQRLSPQNHVSVGNIAPYAACLSRQISELNALVWSWSCTRSWFNNFPRAYSAIGVSDFSEARTRAFGQVTNRDAAVRKPTRLVDWKDFLSPKKKSSNEKCYKQ